MAEVIRMPKMSDTMEEGVIASWQVKVGDTIKAGDVLAEVETDKATMELESYQDGTLLHIGVQVGDAVPVNAIIAVIGNKGEDISGLLKEDKGGNGQQQEAPAKAQADAAPQAKQEEKKATAPAADVSSIKATVVRMPKMSDTMQEGVIAAWHKKVGDSVKSGDLLAEVETDKATMELESYEDGTLLYIGVEEGNSVAIDGVIAIIGEKGADYKALLQAEEADAGESEQAPAQKEASASADAAPKATAAPASDGQQQKEQAPAADDDSRIKASPLARKMAKEKGYTLSQIKGSGPEGRIVKADVENFTPGAAAPQAQQAPAAEGQQQQALQLPQVVGEERFEDRKVSQMRKTIAKRLAESKFTAPHFYLTMAIDMDKAISARESLNQISPVKISYNDMVIKAAALALRKHPAVNVSWLGDTMRYNQHINIGVAVAVPEGLLVPVVRFADNKTLSHISAEVKDLGAKAKNKQLQPKDWEGSTFTISNLGMFGIDEFTAIINPPDACIMAVGGISQVPVVKNGAIVPGNVMKVTLSCDHRAVDGAVGAAFLQTFKELLEDPIRMLV
ncbi:pyruvate dehydrogenase complex dihydrolipoamide acetyltransferase [Cesiribacter andamanensis]|uniref:Acetyltransferase component of pyruvate dehydrogenase complex n=1 Tax=Cesiribacter andamanensis AMV16 TaxID=1279009 RepID=M7N5A3_9BACT|nr:pyruvate dehydrogenase complex dihydrolipoamide acetyltransferase [Cesiribacter andamanensis]EMR02477.1 Dihydrolipoyllysine-residue acetyltransferase component of pyruvate dehydrogenase complex [Cesiribacter andamanensis AMV16]